MQGMKMMMFAVGWLLLFMVHPATLQFDDEDILQAPQNVTVAIGDPPLDLVCRVRRDNVFMEIDGQLAGMDGNVDQELRRRGFMFMNQEQTSGVSTQLVMMELNEGNNNTRVACVATDNAGDTRRPNIFSPDAFITILSATIAIEAEDIVVTEGEMREVCFFALQHFKRSIPVQIMYNDGTAIENVDYRATQTEVIISPESNFEGCFNLSIIDDDFYETEKVFFLTFNSTDVDAIIETSSASVVIQDEDGTISSPDVGVTQSTTALPPADTISSPTVPPPAGNSGSMVKVAALSIGGAAVVAFLMLTAQ